MTAARPAWEWEFLDRADAVLDRPLSPAFSARFDAEEWLGLHWRQLAEQGVVAVRLLHDGDPAAPALPLHTA
jgi:hypothetical protein